MRPMRDAIQDYLTLRRSLGFKLQDAGVALAAFASFMAQHRAAHITTALALAWAQEPRWTQPANWARRLSYVRGFARHYSAIDPHTEVPPDGLLPFQPARARPYIYSDEEVERLLASALRLLPDRGLLSWTYYCLFGLLTVAGLRLGEAIRLDLDDVDLQEGVLTIRGTKFGKSRLVPIHASTRAVLAKYRRRRQRLGTVPTKAFFVNSHGNHLDKGEIHRTFYRLSRDVGLRGVTASHGPRLHDLRHRFAVQTLLRWYRAGDDVERRLPVLSTYLGHVHIADTYWYLSGCPELMGLAVGRLERRWEERP
jgi:integrase/recombinase XerD